MRMNSFKSWAFLIPVFLLLTVSHALADTCGDGVVEPSEQCDDNNTTAGDGCNIFCEIDKEGYDGRHAITINASEVDETLSNFPVLLADDNFLSGVYSSTESDGKDLLFSSDIGGSVFLAHEVVNWNTGGETSEVWVKVPSVSSSTDTTIYVWYDNSSAIAPSADADNGSENVWDQYYQAVWHLDETVIDEQTSGTHIDSTANAYNGTQNNNATDTSGKIGNAADFDGTSDYITMGDILDSAFIGSSAEFTFEAWFNSDDVSGGSKVLLSKYGDSACSPAVDQRQILFRTYGGKLAFSVNDAVTSGTTYYKDSTNPISNTTWHHGVMVYDANNYVKLYLDGTDETLTGGGGSMPVDQHDISYPLLMGASCDAGEAYVFSGSIDEVRVSDTIRSSGWISTTHNNQNSPSTFVTPSTGTGLETSAGVNNQSPVPSTTVSDGGSSASSPTAVGQDVTFTATAKDVNADQYYLAVCKTDAVTVGNDNAPTCDGGAWGISTATNSTVQASVAYTTLVGDVGSNDWYAFVCDKVADNAICFPANGNGDQGVAIGTIAFSGVPADGDNITIDGATYEFDTADNGITSGTEVNTAASITGTDVSIALAAVATGDGSSTVSRGSTVYVYANSKGAAGNSVDMSEGLDTNSYITLSGATLSGGDDDNASPFEVTENPLIGTVTIGDTSSGGGLNPATGTDDIDPGETVYFNAEVDQGTVDMYVCDSAGFTYGASPSCTGTEICNVTGVDASTDYPECSSATVASVPTAHGTYTVYIYIQDNSYNQGLGTNNHDYDVQDVAPALGSYVATDEPAPTAGGSDTVDFSATITDGNGDNDVTAVEGVLFDDDTVNNDCAAAESNCYIVNCSLADVSTPGTGKESTGSDGSLTANCSVTFWFNSNPSANWEVHVKPNDGLVQETGLANSEVNLDNPSLSGISINQASIAYGTVALGNVSVRKETSMGNVGNLVIDVFVEGNDMCSDYPTCNNNTISVSQQKFYHTDVDFNYGAAATAPGPYTLVDTASGDDDETGCLNRDIPVRTTHDIDSTNESIWWKLQIPEAQALGTYTGENTFATTASTTCTNAQSY